MKIFIRLFISLVLSCSALGSRAQEIDVFAGAHILGYSPEKSFSEYSKTTFGLGVKDVYKHFGFYCNYYSKSNKIYSDTIVVATLDDYRMELWDTATYHFRIMPQGITFGVNYLFPFRLSVYAGAGVSQPRTEQHRYANVYMPSSTGFYDNLYSSEFSKSVLIEQRKFMFEFGADYDIVPLPRWACGVRVGYNSVMKMVTQLTVGYSFSGLDPDS
jgi:hypothetical protein